MAPVEEQSEPLARTLGCGRAPECTGQAGLWVQVRQAVAAARNTRASGDAPSRTIRGCAAGHAAAALRNTRAPGSLSEVHPPQPCALGSLVFLSPLPPIVSGGLHDHARVPSIPRHSGTFLLFPL